MAQYRVIVEKQEQVELFAEVWQVHNLGQRQIEDLAKMHNAIQLGSPTQLYSETAAKLLGNITHPCLKSFLLFKFQIYAAEDDEADHDYTGSHCHVDAHTYLISLGRTGIVGMVTFH